MIKKLSKFVIISALSISVLSGCSSSAIMEAPLSAEEPVSQGIKASALEMGTESVLLKMFSGKIEAEKVENVSEIFPMGAGEITVSDIQQGERPVCYYLAALAGLAYHRPTDVSKLVGENTDGTFTVTFPGLPKGKNIVTVERPDDAEMSLYIHKGKNNSIWAPVMVKAIAKYWSKNGILRFFKAKTDAANWGGAWESIEILTGHVADFMLVGLNSNERILTKISAGINGKKLVSVSTFGKGNLNPTKVGEIRFSSAHVMTALKVDTMQKTITIRDPYGKVKRLDSQGNIVADSSTDGVFTLPIAEFRKYFQDIAIETDKNGNALTRLRFLK